jgi:hypothetical protein
MHRIKDDVPFKEQLKPFPVDAFQRQRLTPEKPVMYEQHVGFRIRTAVKGFKAGVNGKAIFFMPAPSLSACSPFIEESTDWNSSRSKIDRKYRSRAAVVKTALMVEV